MISGIWIIALLVQILFAIAGVAGESCSGYFRYARKLESNEVIGMIDIPPSLALERYWFILSVFMCINGIIPKPNQSSIAMTLPLHAMIRQIQQGGSLQYRVFFPPGNDAVVYKIKFNHHLLCSEPLPFYRNITLLENTAWIYVPPSAVEGFWLSPPQPAPTWPRPTEPAPTWQRPTQPAPTWPPPTELAPNWPHPTQPAPSLTWPALTPTWPTSDSINPRLPKLTTAFSQDCGRSSNSHVDQLIFRGSQTSSGQWPWVVAIFIRKDSNQFAFQCAGSLVSNTHIVTAAHCFRSGNSSLPVYVFQVSLGRFRLRDWQEADSENRNIAEYRVHPDYDSTKTNADADLAIIVLSESVEYSAKIKPICLWSGTTDLGAVVGMFGCLVGWGEDENGHKYLEEPRMTRELIVDQEDCLRSDPVFATTTSRRTFCAGSRNGTGPCYGDSGSGLIIHNPVSNRYYLRGVVSSSLRDSVSGSCDPYQYSIYVDVAKHLEWVRQQIAA